MSSVSFATLIENCVSGSERKKVDAEIVVLSCANVMNGKTVYDY